MFTKNHFICIVLYTCDLPSWTFDMAWLSKSESDEHGIKIPKKLKLVFQVASLLIKWVLNILKEHSIRGDTHKNSVVKQKAYNKQVWIVFRAVCNFIHEQVFLLLTALYLLGASAPHRLRLWTSLGVSSQLLSSKLREHLSGVWSVRKKNESRLSNS